MSTWESSRDTAKRGTQHSTEVEFSAEAEDQWRALKEEVLANDSEEETPTSGDLCLPKLCTRKRKAPKPIPKPCDAHRPKTQQKTLARAISDTDMDHLFRTYGADHEDDAAIDISKFLQGDDEDDVESTPMNAEELLAKLTNQVFPAMQGESKVVSLNDEKIAPLVKLEDEKLEYETPVVSKDRANLKGSSGTGYLSVERKPEGITLKERLLPTDSPGHTVPRTDQERSCNEGTFYWLDAKEQSYNLAVDPGSVFLFGRLRTELGGKDCFRSCCIRVRNMYRCMFLLPRKDACDADVVQEVNEMCRAQNIEQRRFKFVERYYAFEEPGLPRERSRWVKLRYPAKYPPLSTNSACKHIDAVIGANTSLLELFIIKRKLKGPSFMRIMDMEAACSRISHCELEFIVDSPKKVVVDETKRSPPPLTFASVQLHAQLDAKEAANEVIAASVVVYRDVDIDSAFHTVPSEVLAGIRPSSPTAVLPLDLESYCRSNGLPGVRRFANETELLMWLASTLGTVDADALIGHNFLGFTLDVLLRRYQELNVPGWSTMGRLDLKRFPKLQGSGYSLHQGREVCIGRLVADSYQLAREYYKTVNYKLSALAEQMRLQGIATGVTSFEPGGCVLSPEGMRLSKDIFDVLVQVCNYATLSAAVISNLDVIRLTKRLTALAGNLWSRTLCGARSERIEYLLLHAFHDLKFITPEKKSMGMKRSRDDDEGEDTKRKAKYQGGMVLEPKCGLYSDFILLMDFNSLYPSLIQEFNICFTTVGRGENVEAVVPPPESLLCGSCAAAGLPAPCLHRCILPKVIKGLVDSRREVKRLMLSEKDAKRLALLEIRQKALKLTANSMYGCLGFEFSRFYAQQLAELVTQQGRLALQSTVELIPQISPSLRVIYGDTDSVMIQTGIKSDIRAVHDLGIEIKEKINKRYQSLEIDIDGVFRAILLLKKKKYAALTVVDWQGGGTTYKKEVKGLDMVRRDWCPLSKEVSDAVLNRVLNADGSEDVLDYIMNYMRDVAEHVRLGDRYTLDHFVISKCLTKEPEAYRGDAFPHVTVARRMRQRKETVRVGDLIPYVICDGDKMGEKAFHVDEVRQNTSHHIDAVWYLSSQVYPPVMRLCEHIQGFSAAQLSASMGISYHHIDRMDPEPDGTGANDFSHCALFKSRSLSECFPTALQLQVPCTHCLRKTPIDPHERVSKVLENLDTALDKDGRFDLYVCGSCERSLPVDYVSNCFTQMCYHILHQFYRVGGGTAAVRALRSQFTYFRALFDVPHGLGCPPVVKEYHRVRARRCLGMDRTLYTIEDSEDPRVSATCDPVDPLRAAAETFYRRIDHLFISLETLFNKESESPHARDA